MKSQTNPQVVMWSEEHGIEAFNFDSLQEAQEGFERIKAVCRADKQGSERHLFLSIATWRTSDDDQPACSDRSKQIMTKNFTVTFEIDQAIRWELYKTSLADKLIDRAAEDFDCPEGISGSAYTGEIEVKDRLFVVTLTEGEKT